MLATGGFAGLEDRALIGGRQEAAVEVVEAAGRDQAAVEDDEAGQVLVLAAQAVTDPRPHARPALEAGAGVQEVVGAVCSGKFDTIERTTPGRRHARPGAETGR